MQMQRTVLPQTSMRLISDGHPNRLQRSISCTACSIAAGTNWTSRNLNSHAKKAAGCFILLLLPFLFLQGLSGLLPSCLKRASRPFKKGNLLLCLALPSPACTAASGRTAAAFAAAPTASAATAAAKEHHQDIQQKIRHGSAEKLEINENQDKDPKPD